MRFVAIFLAFMFANNLLFSHFLGLSEFLGSTGTKTWLRRAVVLTIVFVSGSLIFWLADVLFLQPFHLAFLRTLLIVLVLWLIVTLYSGFVGSVQGDATWPHSKEILLHSVLLGGILLTTSQAQNSLEVVVGALAAALGYFVSFGLVQAVFSRLSRERIPALIQGLPLQLFTFGLVWLIFTGLSFQIPGVSP